MRHIFRSLCPFYRSPYQWWCKEERHIKKFCSVGAFCLVRTECLSSRTIEFFFLHRSVIVTQQNKRTDSILHSILATLHTYQQLTREKNIEGLTSIEKPNNWSNCYRIAMTSTDVETKEISPLAARSHHISQQPIDRHSVEITDEHKSVFINAGIDSTW